MYKCTIKCLLLLCISAVTMSSHSENGITEKSILIGQTVGVTGTVAAPVKEMNEGANAYFSTVNQQGGIYGRKIQLLTLDDKFDPKLTLSNAETLITKERVFALFQGRGTPHTKGIMPMLAAHNIPLVAPSTGATVLHEPVHRYVFNIRAKYHSEIEKVVEHLSTTGIKRIGLLHVDDAFGDDALDGFTRAMTTHKISPAAVIKFDRVKPNYEVTAKEVINAAPAAIIIASSTTNTVNVIKAIRANGGLMQILTLSNNSSEAFIKDLGDAGLGVIITQITPAPHLISTPLGQEFQIAAKAFGATISYPAIEGFMNAKVLVDALRRAGKNPTRDKFIVALESMKRVDFGGLMVTYSAQDHTGSEFVELTMIAKNGRLVR